MKSLLIGLFLFPIFSFSQVNTPTWGVEDTILVISKTTDFGPVHDYIELFNNSGQDLDMRWVCLEPSSWPSLWITGFTDPTLNHNDVEHLDSADFLIPFPIEWSNKLIIGVEHNSYAHTDTVVFDVWPLSAPADKLRLYYVIIIAQGNAWATISEQSQIDYAYNSGSEKLILKSSSNLKSVQLFDLSGKLLLAKDLEEFGTDVTIDMSSVEENLVIVQVVFDNGEEQSLKIPLR